MKRNHLYSGKPAIFALLLGIAAYCPHPMRAQALLSKQPAAVGAPVTAVATGSAKRTGPYDETQKLRIAFALKPPRQEEERKFLEQLQDRNLPNSIVF